MNSILLLAEIESQTICLDPDSAEGKALRRICDSESDENLLTIVDDGEESDLEVEELRKSGWVVKTVSQVKQEFESSLSH